MTIDILAGIMVITALVREDEISQSSLVRLVTTLTLTQYYFRVKGEQQTMAA